MSANFSTQITPTAEHKGHTTTIMILTLPYPDIDPVIFSIGPLILRWYALAYITGLVLGWYYCIRLGAISAERFTQQIFDDFLVWATIAVLLGGRLGYVLFYNPAFYFEHPGKILAVWQGGMSFHGGCLGMLIATLIFVRRRKLSLFAFGDIIAAAAPIGLFFGRIANFINGELFGRASDAPWAMVFPTGGPMARHPSQLYEALLEGLALFLVIFYLIFRKDALDKPGLISGVFFTGYGLSRLFVELFRQPDAHLGFYFAYATLGQLLSLPMVLFGLWLMTRPATGSGPSAK